MALYIEKRTDYREIYKAPVTVQELDDGFIYRARMANVSNKGMYIETDVVLEAGADIIIGIEDSPEISVSVSSNGAKFYLSKIIWQTDLIDSIFNFGYGVKIISADDTQTDSDTSSDLRQEWRKHRRRSYSKPVFITSRDQNHKGVINNISRGGVFIETKETFTTGQIIRLVIPGTKIDKGVMLKGEVVRFNQFGIGIVFKSLIKRHVDKKSLGY